MYNVLQCAPRRSTHTECVASLRLEDQFGRSRARVAGRHPPASPSLVSIPVPIPLPIRSLPIRTSISLIRPRSFSERIPPALSSMTTSFPIARLKTTMVLQSLIQLPPPCSIIQAIIHIKFKLRLECVSVNLQSLQHVEPISLWVPVQRESSKIVSIQTRGRQTRCNPLMKTNRH